MHDNTLESIAKIDSCRFVIRSTQERKCTNGHVESKHLANSIKHGSKIV